MACSSDDCYFSVMTTFASRNPGPRTDRIVQGLVLGSRLSMSWQVLFVSSSFFASPSLVSFLASSTDTYLVENGSLYLQISSAPSDFVLADLS